MAIPYVEIELPWGYPDMTPQHCPVCGARVFERPCPHLVFGFTDEAGEFGYLRDEEVRRLVDDITAAMEEAEEEDVENDLYLPRMLAERLDGEAMLCIRFLPTFTGPHGALCFDFGVEGEEEEERGGASGGC